MTDELEPDDGKGSLWPTRVLWTGIGAFGVSAINAGAMLIFGWNMNSIATAVDILTSLGLLATAAWAGTVGVETMRASKASSQAAITANKQAARDSHEATRPYVDALIVPGLAGTTEFDLLVRNTGKSAAREVQINCKAEVDRDDDVTRAVAEMFATPRTMGPSTELRMMWQLGESDADADSTDSSGKPVEGKMGMPDDAVLTISYKSNDGEEPYTEVVDVRCFHSGLWPVSQQGSLPKGKGAPIQPKHILSTLRAIARHTGDNNR